MSQKNFDADVTQLIQLVTHSIYSTKEVFLRELLANANDAIQKAKVASAKDAGYLGEELDLSIQIMLDEQDKNTVIEITDTGIGMSHDEVVENIGTIAKSGTKAFLDQIKKQKEQNGDLIGQFGIGFYSAFMVADRVELETKKMGEDAVLWKSEGKGTYEIEPSPKTTRGTTIRLYLNDDAKEFASYSKLKTLIKKHANYVPVPIRMPELNDAGEPQEKMEQVNAMKSLWTRQKSEITEEEYHDFYTALSLDQHKPLDTIHLAIEGVINFKAVLYIPKNPPTFGHIDPEKEFGPALYVQNVMIMEHAKALLPVRLRFVKGVVETPDLSLNVSRELIQSDALLAKIQKTLVKEVLKSLKRIQTSDHQAYAEFYEHYNRYIKEGVHYDRTHKEQLAGLLMYQTRLSKERKAFDAVLPVSEGGEEKKESPKESEDSTDSNESSQEDKSPLYYLTGPNIEQLRSSPYLEQFEGTDTDVVLMDDPIDERVVQGLFDYKGHPLKNAMHATLDAKDDDDAASQKVVKKQEEENKDFLGFVKSTIGEDRIETVKLSTKMKSSLAMLTAKEGQTSAQMERIMQAMGQELAKGKRTLELNINHDLIQSVMKQFADDGKSQKIEELVHYLYDQAVMLEGGQVDDINAFLKRANSLVSL